MNDDEKAAKGGDDYTCRITSVKNCPSLRMNLLGPTNIVLDYVKAVHVDLATRRDKHIWHFSLNGVPKFLVDAFKFLEDTNAFHVDGIFRKEGNASRLKNAWTIYCGISPLPLECTAHDVCSLIKRFFREIKAPIFDDCQANILKFAESLNNSEDTVFKAISAVIERLPAVNAVTLTFLLKQLRKVSEYSDENRMTVENLATVFAPSLFRDETPITKSTKKKKDDQFNIMNFVRSRNNLQISVVKLLITKSHLLCPSREVKLSRHFSERFPGGCAKEPVLSASSVTPTRNAIPDENTSPNRPKDDADPTNVSLSKSFLTCSTREVKLSRHCSDRFVGGCGAKGPLASRASVKRITFAIDKEAPPSLSAAPTVAKKYNAPLAVSRSRWIQQPQQQVPPPYAFRRTRAFASDYEKICTRCDVRGHLLKECPKAGRAPLTTTTTAASLRN